MILTVSPKMEILALNLTEDSEETQYCFPNLKGSCLRSQTLILIKVAMYICMGFIILMTVCGNLLVIISISHFRQLHSPTNLIILSLAFADWFLGAFVMPYTMITYVENCWYFGETFCKIHTSTDITLCVASLLHLGLISADRYLAICKPLQYRTSVTMHKVAALIGIIWMFSFSFGFGVILSQVNLVSGEELFINYCTGSCILFFSKEKAMVAVFVAFFIPGSVMLALYMKIFCVAKVQARKINFSLAMTRAQCDKKCTSEHRERKAAKTLAIVLGAFLLCWFPFIMVLVVDPFFDYSTPTVVFEAFGWLGGFNSTCNPLIYGFFYPWFRRVFKIIISGKVFQNGSSLLNIYAERN
ncbi:trace amine-associated receptor 4-like [Anguilla anguilla]|uniref:trace amine-associated receptor 4-like n=1 Tax=Anguilla anguilla TaxID=7936 RepID=UPI0015A78C14|nr:trace amine-associated receptor 4-like [Anguilla anguilla]